MDAQPRRRNGYAPIRDYAIVGNKRTAALIARDGSVDWMSPAGFDAPSAFGALLDSEAGGRFELAPCEPFEAERRYRPGTNVLETTFTTAAGAVRVTDAMSMPLARSVSFNELVRKVEGLAGEVPMRWRVAPRFGYGRRRGTTCRQHDVPVIVDDALTMAVLAHDAGDAQLHDGIVAGEFTARDGTAAVIGLSCFDGGPRAFSTPEQLLDRLEATAERWELWSNGCAYDGPWRDAVLRSVLTLDMLVDERNGAIIAAPTMGLPEALGGERNYDYRYAWLRDGNLTLEAMLRAGFREQVHASLAWMTAATRRTHPLLRPIHGIDGAPRLPDEQLEHLPGYRGSSPVTLGNSAQSQLQLGTYADVLEMVWHYAGEGNGLGEELAVRMAELADFVCRIWMRPDAGLWELGDRRHYTQSKLACWLALHRAGQLADQGLIPGDRRARWSATAAEIERFVETRCWSPRLGAYTRAADSDELDAAVLLAARGAFIDDRPERLAGTVDAIRRELGAGDALVYRYTGMRDEEGAFLACSFWAAEALARAGRVDEAFETMDRLVELANDVGLYSEEIEPETLEFRGNMPQALTHLGLVNAAHVLERARREASRPEPAVAD